MRVLVVEDEPAVAASLAEGLVAASYAVDVADNGIEGCRRALSDVYDMVVLDLMLPGMDGFEVLRELRAKNIRTPVLCLTARDTVDDRVKGLDLGADDYLTKPFSFAELLARMRALFRRREQLRDNPIIVADLRVDIITRNVQRGNKRIDLSPTEYTLLEFLARSVNEVLPRSMILKHVWHMSHDPMTNVVDVHINRLRKKVDHGFDPPLIHTIRGVGYVLRCDDV